MTKRAQFAAFLFFLSCAHATDKPKLPDRVHAAKTIAVVAHVGRVPGASDLKRESKLKAEAENELRTEPYLEVLNDPDKADLVMLVLGGDKTVLKELSSLPIPPLFQPHLWDTVEVMGVLVLGGQQPDWSAVPLWIGERSAARDVIDLFQNYLRHGGKPRLEPQTRIQVSEPKRAEKTLPPHKEAKVLLELVSAKTVSLLYFFPDRPEGSSSPDPPTIRPRAGGISVGESLGRWGRFKPIADAAKADVVVAVYRDWWDYDWAEAATGVRGEGEGRQALLIFRGGQRPDWASIPSWMEQAHDWEQSKGSYVQPDLVKLLRRDVERAERGNQVSK